MAPPKSASSTATGARSLSGYRNINFTSQPINNLEGAASRLARCLHYATTTQLHELCSKKHEATQKVIIAFCKDRNASFGVPESFTGRKTVNNSCVSQVIENLPQYTSALMDTEPPTTDSPNVSDANLFDIRQAWWNRQFLLTRPSDIGRCSQLSHTPFTMDAKEALLAWKVLTFFSHHYKSKPFITFQGHNSRATPPSFLTPSAAPGSSSATHVSALENAIALSAHSELSEDTMDDPDLASNISDPTVTDEFYTTLVSGLGNYLNSPATSAVGRPRLTQDDLKALHDCLCSPRFLSSHIQRYVEYNSTKKMLAQLAGGYREFLEQAPVPSSTENNTVEDTTYALLGALLGLHPLAPNRREMNDHRELGQMTANKHGTLVSTRQTDAQLGHRRKATGEDLNPAPLKHQRHTSSDLQ